MESPGTLLAAASAPMARKQRSHACLRACGAHPCYSCSIAVGHRPNGAFAAIGYSTHPFQPRDRPPMTPPLGFALHLEAERRFATIELSGYSHTHTTNTADRAAAAVLPRRQAAARPPCSNPHNLRRSRPPCCIQVPRRRRLHSYQFCCLHIGQRIVPTQLGTGGLAFHPVARLTLGVGFC